MAFGSGGMAGGGTWTIPQGTLGPIMFGPPAPHDTGYNTAQLQGENQKELARISGQTQRDVTGIQAEAQKYPATLAQQRWQTTFPWVQGQFGALSQALQGGGQGGGFGTAQGQPAISAAPVYSDAQIQQQVNAQRATNDQATQGQVRASNQKLAGRGMGGNSPLSQALGAMYQGQNLQTNTANERETRMGAAQMNSKQVLAGQQAQEGQFASRQEEQIRRETAARQQQSALFAALAGMI